MPLRLVFMGAPEFSASILRELAAWPGGRVAGVYTQPDRPCGRGQQCRPTPVKVLALEHGLPVFAPPSLKGESEIAALGDLRPDVLVVAAYGLILPQAVLDIPVHGAINVHTSLLPKYRGAAPIQRAILAGETMTGVSIMRMEAGLDSGPILRQRALAIGVNESASEIEAQMAALGAKLLLEVLKRLTKGGLVSVAQDPAKATYAPKVEKREGRIEFAQPAQDVHNRIRAMTQSPGAFFLWQASHLSGEMRLNVRPGRIGGPRPDHALPGQMFDTEGEELAVACADRVYLLREVQPAGKKWISAKAFACGYLSKACVE